MDKHSVHYEAYAISEQERDNSTFCQSASSEDVNELLYSSHSPDRIKRRFENMVKQLEIAVHNGNTSDFLISKAKAVSAVLDAMSINIIKERG